MTPPDTSTDDTGIFGSWKPSDYIELRVKQYQGWYDKKAVKAKSIYLRMRTATVLGGVVVPVIVNSGLPGKEAIASVISVLVAACVALESVYHYREQWKNYRSTEQFLSREQVLFLTGEGVYKESSSPQAAFIHFVERCEGAIEAENISTLDVMTLGQPDAKPSRARAGGEK